MRLCALYIAVIGCVALAGCGPASSTAQVAIVQAHEPGLQWQLPVGWAPAYTGDGIRWGSINGPQGAEITVTRFPGSVGEELANINRWRQQAGMAPVNSGSLAPVEGAKMPWRMAVIREGADKPTIAGAIAPVEGTSLVLKLTLPPGTTGTDQLIADYTAIVRSAIWQ